MMIGTCIPLALCSGHVVRLFRGTVVALLATCFIHQAHGDEATDFFESKIRPVLVKHCYECHSTESSSVQGGLVLDDRQGMRRGGESGPSVVPGKPGEGELLAALRYESFEMPPEGKLSDQVIADFETWIRMGAPDPRESTSEPIEPSTLNIAARRDFWSFKPPEFQSLPATDDATQWAETRVDAFVLQGLVDAKLAPSPRAEKRKLLRRLSFDLVGMPPTGSMIRQFVQDDSPDAYLRLVDQLLSSPALGERWARVWMDVMRYAEDQAHIVGNNRSLCYPNAYRYRDWLISALNEDLPYDEFLRLQLAADLIDSDSSTPLVALGFIGLGPKYYRRGDAEVMADEWEDRIDTLSRGVLGLTVACARCHDHKYDPISTQDYYALAGVFASTQMYNQPLDAKAEKDKSGQAKKPEQSLHLVRDNQPRDLNVMIRGDVNRKGPVVPRRFLEVLSRQPIPLQQGSGRRQLAEAIVDRSNPLTARVFVNRVWAQLFGTAIVDTPSNFGELGSRPSHPELLDDLAVRFMDSGWSLKWLLGELVTSAAYCQDSQVDPKAMQVDPENRLLWRMQPKRLSIEQYRDALFTTAGLLDHRLGGKSIQPDDPQANRKGVYSEISRLEVNSMLARFDFPDPNAHSARRVETTTPLQKLFLLNSPLMLRAADGLADRLVEEESDLPNQIALAYELLYARTPSTRELQIATQFISNGQRDRLTDYCQALLAANEMFMID